MSNRGPGVLLEPADVEQARARIDGRVHVTPTMSVTTLGDELGVRLHLKAEPFQKTGSFKPRGVFNKLLSMSRTDLSRGLVSMSAGNHAAALAYGATAVGVRATIVMPATAMPSKVEATKRYGGEVVQTDGSVLGGGGLISGIAVAVKLQRPSIRVVGVEPHGADAMSRSLERGAPVHLERVDTIADGLAPPFAREHTLRHVEHFVDEMVRVADSEIVNALRVLIQRAKLAAEPSGGASLAALLSGRASPAAGSTVVCVISGGNVAPDVLKNLL